MRREQHALTRVVYQYLTMKIVRPKRKACNSGCWAKNYYCRYIETE